MLSRALSGLALNNFPKARPGGMLQSFARPARRGAVNAAMAGYLLLAGGGMVALSPVSGGVALGAALACFGYYRWMACRQFGGVTGDLAGFFLQLCELSVALAVALTWRCV